MKLTIDRRANAAYLTVSTNPIKETKPVSEYCNVDLDENGAIVGLEMLFISEYAADFKVWLDLAGAADYFQKSQETIRRWAKSGQLQYYKFGRDFCFKKEDIDSFILKNKYA